MRGDKVDRLLVFERDGWICKLCDEPIDSTLRLPHPKAATLDHIVPVAIGGAHTYDNVQSAHAECNFQKGDKCRI
jgi:5-methylcytosine-specific restriction endonuclease McrA